MLQRMTTESAQLEAARAVKEKAVKVVGRSARVCGVGITRQGGVYAVKVNVEEEPAERETLPEEIDGVPIFIKVVGKIRKQ